MGRELLQKEPVFRKVIEECDALLSNYTDCSLLKELQAEESDSRLQDTYIAQPALFALQVALVALWQSWGIVPAAVVGHSLGEVAAACVAGVLSLSEAIYLIYHRGRLMQQATGAGKMAAVWLPQAQVESLLSTYKGRLSVAAVNSPNATVLSGDADALEEVLSKLEQQGVSSKMLPVNYAFHCPQMEPMQKELVALLKDLKPQPEMIPIYSTVTGSLSQDLTFDSNYWGRNLREPVQFAAAVDALLQTGHRIFVEIGPHPVLATNLTQCLEYWQQQGTCLTSLRRFEDERATMLTALSHLYTLGCQVNWQGLYPEGEWFFIPLPTYPWQRERFWLECGGCNNPPTPSPRSASREPIQETASLSQDLRNTILSADSEEREHRLTNYLREQLTRVLRQSTAGLDLHQPLTTLGLDSIMVIELKNRVLKDLGRDIPVNLFFNGISLAQLVEFVATQARASTPSALASVKTLTPTTDWNQFRIWRDEFQPGQVLRIERHLVHKDEEHNVLIARLEKVADDTVIAEMTQDLQHPFFYEHPKDHVPGLYLIEATRQLVTALSHLYCGVPMRMSFILDELQARYHRLAETNQPLFLVCKMRDPVYVRGQLLQMYCDTTLVQDDAVVAEVNCLFRIFEPVGYGHLRSKKLQGLKV
jgi:acyl transferase domain-containing protein